MIGASDDRVIERRPALATVAAVLHLILGLCCLGLPAYLLYLTGTPEVRNDKDAADAIHGLKIAALVLAPIALPFLISFIGLWKGRIWGWIVGVATSAFASVLFIYDTIGDRSREWDDIVVVAIFPVLLVLLTLGPVRRWCWRRSGWRPGAAGVVG